jgi:nucleotide-binding universal stress UspA family protein
MFQNILVPLDGSKLAENALRPAMELAQKFEGEITLLRVVRSPYPITDLSGAAYGDMVVGMREILQDEAKGYLQAQKGSLTGQGYKVKTHLIDGDMVADQILDVAQAQKMDVIVMSTHGRSGVGRWVYGSVADRVLQHATIPILLVRVSE